MAITDTILPSIKAIKARGRTKHLILGIYNEGGEYRSHNENCKSRDNCRFTCKVKKRTEGKRKQSLQWYDKSSVDEKLTPSDQPKFGLASGTRGEHADVFQQQLVSEEAIHLGHDEGLHMLSLRSSSWIGENARASA